MINQERANQGLGPLAAQGQLAAAARIHSQDMACNNFFSHTGSDGSTFASRIYAQGYGFSAAGENLYAGGGAADAFYAWMNSAGHRANMLNPGYTEAGIGYIYEPNSPYGSYFTAEFAAP